MYCCMLFPFTPFSTFLEQPGVVSPVQHNTITMWACTAPGSRSLTHALMQLKRPMPCSSAKLPSGRVQAEPRCPVYP
jgi:hypothetical protein